MELSVDKYGLWDKFCLESDEAWFWHTTKWLQYCVVYGRQNYETQNLSFMLLDDCGILAICPLLLEKKSGPDGMVHFEFLISGEHSIAPALRNNLTEERSEKILRLIFERIDILAKEYSVARISFRITQSAIRPYKYNVFMKYGYFDNSVNTQIIDLTIPLESIWTNVRKGHKYDIRRGEKNYEVVIYDKNNIKKEIFEQYRILHHKAAGRITRPVETFEMMYDWIFDDKGILCSVSKEGKFVGFTYVNIYKNNAFYSSASDDPDFVADVPISHVIQWKIIKWLKENRCNCYELGTQQFGLQIYDIPDKKAIDISYFKRGFGGKTVPFFRGEKFYDLSYMRKVFEYRTNLLLTKISETK